VLATRGQDSLTARMAKKSHLPKRDAKPPRVVYQATNEQYDAFTRATLLGNFRSVNQWAAHALIAASRKDK
jgi:hypothetical protein